MAEARTLACKSDVELSIRADRLAAALLQRAGADGAAELREPERERYEIVILSSGPIGLDIVDGADGKGGPPFVANVRAGSAAARARATPGSWLLRMADQDVTNFTHEQCAEISQKASRPLRVELERDRIHSDASTDRGSDWSDAWSDDAGRHATQFDARELVLRMLLGGARGVANQLSALPSSPLLSHHRGRHHALAGVATDSDSDDTKASGAASKRRHHSRSALQELWKQHQKSEVSESDFRNFVLAGGGLRREAFGRATSLVRRAVSTQPRQGAERQARARAGLEVELHWMRIIRRIDPLRPHSASDAAIDATIPLGRFVNGAYNLLRAASTRGSSTMQPTYLLATVRSLARRIAGLGAQPSNGRAPVVGVLAASLIRRSEGDALFGQPLGQWP